MTILPNNFSDEDVVEAFMECFPHIWEDIEFFCKIRQSDYFRRKQKGLRTVPFFSPQSYFLKHCRCNKHLVSQVSSEEKLKKRHLLAELGRKKLQCAKTNLQITLFIYKRFVQVILKS